MIGSDHLHQKGAAAAVTSHEEGLGRSALADHGSASALAHGLWLGQVTEFGPICGELK